MPDTAPPTPGAAGNAIAPIDNRIAVLILQHPQEQDHLLGTAQLATACLTNATLRIGLSWPSLAKALGRPADPKRWAILHLGSARPADLPKGREIVALDRKGHPLKDQDAALAQIEGVVLFDGTWSQAKTLWWRNPWVLKAQRIVLNPRTPSLYGKLRREPRREGLSTIEAAGLILAGLEGRPEIETTLRDALGRMLDRYRAASNRA
jgi:DTW domain-containing protein YfiP